MLGGRLGHRVVDHLADQQGIVAVGVVLHQRWRDGWGDDIQSDPVHVLDSRVDVRQLDRQLLGELTKAEVDLELVVVGNIPALERDLAVSDSGHECSRYVVPVDVDFHAHELLEWGFEAPAENSPALRATPHAEGRMTTSSQRQATSGPQDTRAPPKHSVPRPLRDGDRDFTHRAHRVNRRVVTLRPRTSRHQAAVSAGPAVHFDIKAHFVDRQRLGSYRQPGSGHSPAATGHRLEERAVRIEWDTPITMDDGLVLRADVFRPDGRRAGSRSILSYGPYAKGLPFQEGYPTRGSRRRAAIPRSQPGRPTSTRPGRSSTPSGGCRTVTSCVRVDSRGAGRSPGYIDPSRRARPRTSTSASSGPARQPWSNGKVGLLGISYYAINQWHVAALQPPHLAAMIPWEGVGRLLPRRNYHGGIASAHSKDVWYGAPATTVQHGLGETRPRNELHR